MGWSSKYLAVEVDGLHQLFVPEKLPSQKDVIQASFMMILQVINYTSTTNHGWSTYPPLTYPPQK